MSAVSRACSADFTANNAFPACFRKVSLSKSGSEAWIWPRPIAGSITESLWAESSAATGTELCAGRDLDTALGTRRGPRRVRCREHGARQAHARDNCGSRPFGALGGSLADAFHRLAGGRALEAAGELRVLDVTAVLLQRLFVSGLDRDHEVAHPGDADAIRIEDLGGRSERFLLDDLVLARDAQDRPSFVGDVRHHIGAKDLEQLVAHPVRDLIVAQ